MTGQTQLENLAEQNDRRKAKVLQSSETRQHWLFVSMGLEPAPAALEFDPHAVPFYQPPEWFKPFMLAMEKKDASF